MSLAIYLFSVAIDNFNFLAACRVEYFSIRRHPIRCSVEVK
jgi:hypothetical protein